jgi:hypothetical protein
MKRSSGSICVRWLFENVVCSTCTPTSCSPVSARASHQHLRLQAIAVADMKHSKGRSRVDCL